ncbi:hypothetical protein [Melghirimyces algeriensis]|uniref:Uncharacterized protein n=1 Tax=Melghirimyces algeriensis TaxID=910412 RepID=A0A521EZC4_9BACL|nr:hypothetical protein [Melghirimyces algeriensis]SMO89176.1 hypothetical protein SAMN06264849_11189 [Melghirimyces algeriensis]
MPDCKKSLGLIFTFVMLFSLWITPVQAKEKSLFETRWKIKVNDDDSVRMVVGLGGSGLFEEVISESASDLEEELTDQDDTDLIEHIKTTTRTEGDKNIVEAQLDFASIDDFNKYCKEEDLEVEIKKEEGFFFDTYLLPLKLDDDLRDWSDAEEERIDPRFLVEVTMPGSIEEDQTSTSSLKENTAHWNIDLTKAKENQKIVTVTSKANWPVYVFGVLGGLIALAVIFVVVMIIIGSKKSGMSPNSTHNSQT